MTGHCDRDVAARTTPSSSLLPARCSGCERLSEPRQLGRTPKGWKRGDTLHSATFTGQGHYFCESCWTAVRHG
jgi:hypothetical protein